MSNAPETWANEKNLVFASLVSQGRETTKKYNQNPRP